MFWQRVTYSIPRSTVFLGTEIPVFRAPRRAMSWAGGDRDIGLVGGGGVAPAPLVVLGIDDEVDRPPQQAAESGAIGRPVGFGQEHRGEAVAVHRTVVADSFFDDVAGRGGAALEVVDDAVDLRAVRAAGRGAAGRGRRVRELGDADVLPVAAGGAERAVRELPLRQPLQAAVDGGLCLRRHEGGRRSRVGLPVRREEQRQAGCAPNRAMKSRRRIPNDAPAESPQ